MNERAKALISAPGNVTPQTELTTTREIKKAMRRNLYVSGNYGVYCTSLGWKHRVFDARSRKGELEVKINTGNWIKPGRVWSEG